MLSTYVDDNNLIAEVQPEGFIYNETTGKTELSAEAMVEDTGLEDDHRTMRLLRTSQQS